MTQQQPPLGGGPAASTPPSFKVGDRVVGTYKDALGQPHDFAGTITSWNVTLGMWRVALDDGGLNIAFAESTLKHE